jgi:hypothetical protein
LFAVNEILEGRLSVQMSPVQWHTHIELLQSFTQAAKKAAFSQEETRVDARSSVVLVAGTQPLSLNSATVITIPEPSRSLTDTGSDVTVKPGEVVPSAIAPHEAKSIDSFHSLTEEMDDIGGDGHSPIAEEERGPQPASPR